ncbi:hypothetical protein [Desulfosporosinus youngiae]|uniref:Uncharacterized protein n=1 Tax=Desulfosporosinus youngiae DSM 17734 TaxID=768710 RepID=H5XY21_9FIRM|nr:hypothetical protein [Desulfosporosinus youngiae]EHQ91524.1 hypothetical protein DesyoDRAFT_4570 [Desulfosporosinus youngiae DSM 17734]
MYRLISEISPNFLIQGFGLHQDENEIYVGKVGGQEVQLIPIDHLHSDHFQADEKDTKIFSVGFAEADSHFRSGDVLMTGSDDLLDRAFRAMDEMEQRGVVVSLTPPQDSKHLYLCKDQMNPFVQEWRSRKFSFLCLWMVDPVDSEGQAKLVSILRKVILKD